MKKIFFLLTFLSLRSLAQLPETRIMVFEIQRNPKGFTISDPVWQTNKKGYNNQPSFTPDDRYMLFSSSMDSTNTEIMRVDMSKKKWRLKRLTHSKEPEYSPRITPSEDHISCVSVEKDKVTQHFYLYNLKGKKPKLISPELKSIGYYEWLSPHEYVSFELPEPFYFVKHNLNNHTTDTLCNSIGRTFYYVRSKGRMIYVDKSDTNHYLLKAMNPSPRASEKHNLSVSVLGETLPKEEDFCVMMDGTLLMGHEGVLYMKKNPLKFPNEPWQIVKDLKPYGLKEFKRLAVSRDNTKLAIVITQE